MFTHISQFILCSQNIFLHFVALLCIPSAQPAHWEWWSQTCVPYIWCCRRVCLLIMTTSPPAPICSGATISGERPAALVSPTDLIGEGVSHSRNRGEVDSFCWYRHSLFVVRSWCVLHCRATLWWVVRSNMKMVSCFIEKVLSVHRHRVPSKAA